MSPKNVHSPCTGITKVVAILGASALAALALYMFLPREPSYHGKPLSRWLQGFGHGAEKEREAAEAIRAMGSNSLPYLLAG